MTAPRAPVSILMLASAAVCRCAWLASSALERGGWRTVGGLADPSGPSSSAAGLAEA